MQWQFKIITWESLYSDQLLTEMPTMKRKYPPWYQTSGMKPITGFLTPADKKKLKKMAKDADKSLTRYVTRLLLHHIRAIEHNHEEK